MITLYRKEIDAAADKLEEKFRALVLAYRTEIRENQEFPEIHDGKNVIREQNELDHWIENLEKELQWQRSLSGDGCYIDPESGETC